MKIFSRIFVALVFAFLLLLLAAPGILKFTGRKQVPEMTPEKARKLFETVGGVDEINREAGILFNEFGTNEWTPLFPEDLTNAPAISSLYSICRKYSGSDYSGTSVTIFPDNGRHIEIKFGNHWSGKWIYIFDTNSGVKFNSPSNWLQMAPNIFVSR